MLISSVEAKNSRSMHWWPTRSQLDGMFLSQACCWRCSGAALGRGGCSPPRKEGNSSLHSGFKAAGAGCTVTALLLNSANPNLN